jgi:hypothetical protein
MSRPTPRLQHRTRLTCLGNLGINLYLLDEKTGSTEILEEVLHFMPSGVKMESRWSQRSDQVGPEENYK